MKLTFRALALRQQFDKTSKTVNVYMKNIMAQPTLHGSKPEQEPPKTSSMNTWNFNNNESSLIIGNFCFQFCFCC